MQFLGPLGAGKNAGLQQKTGKQPIDDRRLGRSRRFGFDQTGGRPGGCRLSRRSLGCRRQIGRCRRRFRHCGHRRLDNGFRRWRRRQADGRLRLGSDHRPALRRRRRLDLDNGRRRGFDARWRRRLDRCLGLFGGRWFRQVFCRRDRLRHFLFRRHRHRLCEHGRFSLVGRIGQVIEEGQHAEQDRHQNTGHGEALDQLAAQFAGRAVVIAFCRLFCHGHPQCS